MVTGRPTVMTETILQKLEEGFCAGLTDEECCLYANICTSTLYNYCNDNKDFLERKELLKRQPLIRAKLNVTKNINMGDLTDSKWYLERKGKKEFSLRTENDTTLGGKIEICLSNELNEIGD